VQEGSKLTWKLGDMNRGQVRALKVNVKADKEGELVSCSSVFAVPRVCVSTMVGRPQLAIRKTGPEMAQLGAEVAYTVVVQNTGNTIAKDVRVIDLVPDGLSSASGQKELSFQVGDLDPGASKNIPVPLKAEKRGKVRNVAVAESSNAGKVEAEAITVIAQPGIEIAKSTPDKSIFVNRVATYEIVVSNTGDTDLTGVVLTDSAAPETVIATAEGATVSGTTATWNVGELKTGEKKAFAVKILSRVPGTFVNRASVVTAQGLSDTAQDSTEWKGITGILLEMADDTDPIQVGETSTFTIRVTNQGANQAIMELNIVATLPEELDVIANTVSDAGVVSGKTITWPAMQNVAPKVTVGRTFSVKAVRAGDARSKVSITTLLRKDPIEKFESTTVY